MGNGYTGQLGCFVNGSVNECLFDTRNCFLKGVCSIDNVYWSFNGIDPLDDNQEVMENWGLFLVAEGTDGCTNDDRVNFKIKPSLITFDYGNMNFVRNFTNDFKANAFWYAVRDCSGTNCLGISEIDLVNNPNVRFEAQFDGHTPRGSNYITITRFDRDEDLCGNFNIELGELCDVGYDENDPEDDVLPGGKNECSDHEGELEDGREYEWGGGKLRCVDCQFIDTKSCECKGDGCEE